MLHRLSKAPLPFILLCIALIVPLVSLYYSLANDFDGLYGQDSFAYLNYANIALHEQLIPPPPFYWPPGYPLLIYGLSYIIGTSALSGQLISVTGGALIVFFTGLLTAELLHDHPHRKIGAASAALAIAVMGHMWQLSTVIMADTTALAATVMGMWALTRYTRDEHEQSSKWLVLAAVAIGYAIMTRWAYAIIAVICLLHTLPILWRHYKKFPSQAIRHAAYALIAAALVVGPVLLSALLSTDTTYGGNFSYQLDRWDIFNAFRRNFVNPDGYENYRLFNGIYYSILPARSFYFGLILAAFALPGTWFMFRRQKWLIDRLVLGWGLGMFILLIGGAQQNVRFGFAYMPPIAVLIGLGVIYVTNHVKRWIVLGVFMIGVGWAIWGANIWTQNFIDRQQQDYRVVEWVDDEIPDHSELIVFGVTAMMDYYTDHDVHELYYLTIPEIEEITQSQNTLYVLLDLTNVTTQWRDLSPGNNFSWMQENLDLERIGLRYNFTLYRVNS